MKKTIILSLILISFALIAIKAKAEENLSQKLSGRILLQTESLGEAWYLNPQNNKKYYLSRPSDAFNIMREFGIGITNADLNKIQIGFADNIDLADNDLDGINNLLEDAIGTNPDNKDSDNDGYDDKIEIENNYNPLGSGKINYDDNFTGINSGKIFLQIESLGEAWYINPSDKKRYFLSRPSDAFNMMQNLSLGITNANLNKIEIGYIESKADREEEYDDEEINIKIEPEGPLCAECVSMANPDEVFSAAINAIRLGEKDKAKSYFTQKMKNAVEYTMNFLSSDSKLILSNIMADASASSSTTDEKIYSTEVYFSLGGYKVPIDFRLKKQEDNTWLLDNL